MLPQGRYLLHCAVGVAHQLQEGGCPPLVTEPNVLQRKCMKSHLLAIKASCKAKVWVKDGLQNDWKLVPIPPCVRK